MPTTSVAARRGPRKQTLALRVDAETVAKVKLLRNLRPEAASDDLREAFRAAVDEKLGATLSKSLLGSTEKPVSKPIRKPRKGKSNTVPVETATKVSPASESPIPGRCAS